MDPSQKLKISLFLVLLAAFFTSCLVAQDSTLAGFKSKLDPQFAQINIGAFDSLKTIRRADSVRTLWSARIDSLQQISLPDSLFQGKLDSINRRFKEAHDRVEKQLNHIRQQAKKIQDSIQAKMNFFSRPPDPFGINPNLKKHVPPLSSLNADRLNQLKPSTPNLNFTSRDPLARFTELPRNQLKQVTSLREVRAFKSTYGDIGKFSTQFKAYKEDASALVSGNLNGVTAIPELAEKQLSGFADVGGVTEGMGELSKIAKTGQNPEAARAMLQEAALEQATDHLAGKEQLVKTTMASMSKWKQKFKSVGKLEDLPKNLKLPRNGIKGRPFKERFFPGVNFGIKSLKDTLHVHTYPTLTYHLTGRVRVGVGGYYRLVELKKEWRFYQQQAWWGLTAYGAFKIVPGALFRVEVDAFNRPAYSDEGNLIRAWSYRYLVGMQKEFRIGGRFTGSAQALYDFQHKLTAGVPEKLELRVGLEYHLVNKNPLSRKKRLAITGKEKNS